VNGCELVRHGFVQQFNAFLMHNSGSLDLGLDRLTYYILSYKVHKCFPLLPAKEWAYLNR
jgi:hypothetical protein